ncbi:MAG: ArsA family ATPase [Oculatellaceae cyanobacterium Prado106]|jgi:arsenite-transporting ATPase|nr:ArsA family ATPase [Oculatellaceae cyanobacterium Prado106]
MTPDNNLRLILLSGKGGVGKTTLSCGLARHWAQQFPDEQILLISTDPAHSLGDVLMMEVDDEPRSMAIRGASPLENCPNLQVRALDAQRLLQDFKERYGQVLELLVERGSFVQGEDLSPVWDLDWPGLDELMGILEIQRILREQQVDRVVVDMAPSGHTLNLLGLMDFLESFLEALELFQEKHRTLQQSFTGKSQTDAADDFLAEMKADLAAGRSLLQDSTQTACWIVAIAEPMSYLESRRFRTALEQLHIPIGGLFINRIAHPPIVEQQELLLKFADLAHPYPICQVPTQPTEPIGGTALDQLFSQILTSSSIPSATQANPPILPEINPTHDSKLQTPTLKIQRSNSSGFSDFIAEGRRLILVGGKGGVGKTTVAGAIAWGMAERHGDRPVRVISIDPAHSLGDAFSTQLGHESVNITANLSAQEINAKQVLDQFREDYLWELADIMSGSSEDDIIQIAYTPQAWRQIMAQALPGIDEMLALVTVMELLEKGEQDLIILDTAPTGHLLRFLEMPTAMGDWLAWIFKLWIKYQDVVGRTEFMGRLRTLRQRVMQAQKKLIDAQYTEFIAVFQGQRAIVAETERLTAALTKLGVYHRYQVLNRYREGEGAIALPSTPQSLVPLPELPPSLSPFLQVKAAADLLFSSN